MARIHPISLRFVQPDLTDEVPSPPHDALSVEDRRQHLRDHPRSYLGVTRAPEDAESPGETGAHDVLEEGRRFLAQLLEQDVFQAETDPGYFIYRLELEDHRQTGLICGVATGDYDEGMVRIHERINHTRSAHLARHLRVVGVQSSPIALAFKSQPTVVEIMDDVAATTEAVLDFTDHNGLRQQVWQVTRPEDLDRIGPAFAEMPLYLIDGHHRAAAASEDLKQLGSATTDDHLMLATLFPYNQLRSEAFHRLVTVDPTTLEQALNDHFTTRTTTDPEVVLARADSELALAVPATDHADEGAVDASSAVRWVLIDAPFESDDRSALENIDPVRLGRQVLRPVLGLEESDDRLSYRPGMADRAAIDEVKLRAGEVLFLMRPVPARTVMAVSDAGDVMPPKSTYFQPKVRSGLFIRRVPGT